MCVLFCRPTQTGKNFHDIPSWNLIFLLHPTSLHENITQSALFFPHLKLISQQFHIESNKSSMCVYFEIKAHHEDVPT